ELSHIGQSEDLVAFSAAIPPFSNRLHHISINVTGDTDEEMEFKRHLLFDGKLAEYISKGVGGLVGVAQDIQKPAISKSADWKKGGGFEYVGSIVPVSFYPECYRHGAEISTRHNIPYTVLGRMIGCSHGMMFSWSFAFNRADPDSVRHAREALHETDQLVIDLKGTIWKPAVFGQSLMMDRMDPNTLQMMKKVKQMLDPQGIMNPGNWEVR
ncbi:FAD-binding oxidoreductase, partial [bacterium]|nr:FAD-binding oxidoreductase [bacterium]